MPTQPSQRARSRARVGIQSSLVFPESSVRCCSSGEEKQDLCTRASTNRCMQSAELSTGRIQSPLGCLNVTMSQTSLCFIGWRCVLRQDSKNFLPRFSARRQNANAGTMRFEDAVPPSRILQGTDRYSKWKQRFRKQAIFHLEVERSTFADY